MRFEQKARIQATVDEVERAMLDDRYADFLLKNHGVLLEVQPLEKNDDGTIVRRRIRYRPKPVIESIGPKKVPPEFFAFVESSTYDRRSKTLTFTNTPTSNTISKMMVNTGTIRLKDVGGATEREATGDVSLKLPFLMKPLAMIGETVIVREGVKILENEVPVLQRFIVDVLRK